MPVTVAHQLSATTPDDPLYEIKPSNWNDTHAVTFNAAGSEISGAFDNAGGVTFGLETNGKITASAPAGGGGLTNINVSAGTTSNNLSAFEFSNANGVSFGLNGSTITATVATNYQSQGAYLTTAMASNRGSDFVQATAVFNGTNASGTIASNAISVSVNAQTVQTQNLVSILGSTGNISFANSNGITFGGNASTVTASHNGLTSQSNQAFSAGGGSSAFQTLNFNNANGITWSNNAGSVQASYSQSTHEHMAVSAAGGSQNTGTVVFSNSNNVSFGYNGGTITATVTLPSGTDTWFATGANTIAGTNTSGTFANDNYILSGAGGVSVGISNNTVVISAAAGGGGTTNQTGPNIAAGTQTATSGTVVFSNSNGIVFGMSNSSVLTASYNDVTESIFWRPNDLITTVGAPINGSASIVYCPIDHNLSATRMDMIASINVATAANNSSAGFLYSATACVYTLNGATLSSVSSITTNNQMTWSSNATGSVTGGFFLSAPLTFAGAADKYWLGLALSTRATGLTGAATTSLANTVTMMGVGSALQGAFSAREPGTNTANSNGWFYGMGMYSGTSNFSTIGLSNLTQQGTNANRANVAIRMLNV